MLKKSYKGSYTLEAALVAPILLFAIFQGLKLGITLCQEVKESSVYSAELGDLSGVDIFRTTNGLEELWGK